MLSSVPKWNFPFKRFLLRNFGSNWHRPLIFASDHFPPVSDLVDISIIDIIYTYML